MLAQVEILYLAVQVAENMVKLLLLEMLERPTQVAAVVVVP
jgi:hypothetical protein